MLQTIASRSNLIITSVVSQKEQITDTTTTHTYHQERSFRKSSTTYICHNIRTSSARRDRTQHVKSVSGCVRKLPSLYRQVDHACVCFVVSPNQLRETNIRSACALIVPSSKGQLHAYMGTARRNSAKGWRWR